MNRLMDMGASTPNNYKITQIRRPGEIILFADKQNNKFSPYVENSPQSPSLRHGTGNQKAPLGVANVAFVDGHVAIMTNSEVTNVKNYDWTNNFWN
jgi:prepilin-type processing-associated H-X9-DG protein